MQTNWLVHPIVFELLLFFFLCIHCMTHNHYKIDEELAKLAEREDDDDFTSKEQCKFINLLLSVYCGVCVLKI
jgi:hypothetical protein